jgi:hypothetical protein
VTTHNGGKEPVLKPQPKTRSMNGCCLGFLLGPIISEIGLVGWAMYEESRIPSGEAYISGWSLVAIFAWIPGLILGPIVGAILGRIW